MSQTTHIDISLDCPGEEVEQIRLTVGDSQHAVFHLSLQQARTLATALIQHVHRADVSNSVKKAHSRMEDSGARLSALQRA